ncbi:MAG: biotin/lipoyl-binding protein [bacterium]|nr:biotin/lipoyl-binding protein [bacterium]
MKYQTTIGDKSYDIDVGYDGDPGKILVDGEEVSVDYFEVSPNALYSVIIDGKSYELWVRRDESGYEVFAKGRSLSVMVRDERKQRVESLMAEMPGVKKGFTLVAPMPAVVTAVLVEPGDEVTQGDIICRLEAMKMENEMASEIDGVVKEVKASAGDGVEKDQVLIVVE